MTKEKNEKIIKKTFVGLVLFCLLYQPGIYQAKAQDLCSVPVDVVLLMDTSGSMAEGAILSKCVWEELKWVGGSGGSFQCVSYNAEDISELECLAKPTAPQCKETVFTSSSPSKIVSAKTAANSFIDNLGANDQSAIGFFNSQVNIEKQLSSDHLATKSTINGLVPEGSTNIGDAIVAGAAELGSVRANPKANKVMILLTDGKANLPNGDGLNENPADIQYAIDQAIIAAGANYKIFTIGLGSDGEINETMLRNIATSTGASYYHAPNGNDLGVVYQQIAYEVCQYSSISGCKYIAQTPTSTIETSQTAAGWEILLGGKATSTQTTDENGCFSFAGLLAGSYSVLEDANQDKQPFSLVYPQENNYFIDLIEGQNSTNINFLNYLPSCGNQIIDWGFGEVCEIGGVSSCTTTDNYQGTKACETDCLAWAEQCQTQEFCGDGITNGQEECDDSNNGNNDGCSSVCIVEEPPAQVYQCSDNIDNDQDGQIDYPNDPGCESLADDDEADPVAPPTYQCSDGMDNDADGIIDMQDPGCENAEDNDETDPIIPPVNQPPVLTLLGDNPMTIQLNATFTDPGATSTDQEDGDLTSSITAIGAVNTSATGTYPILYSVIDLGGLSATTSRTVIVTSTSTSTPYVNQPPEITLIGGANLEIFVGDTYNDRGATASDPEDGDITNNIIATGTVNTANTGVYKIYYNVHDSQGLAAEEKVRTIVVKEKQTGSGGGAVIWYSSGTSQSTTTSTVVQTTSTLPEVIITSPNVCSYLEDYLRFGDENRPEEVKKLQVFLNIEGFNVAVSGIFDQATFLAVKALQEKYQDQILSPWGIEESTGYVFITTKNFINETYCKIEIALTGEETAEIARIKDILLAASQETSQASTTVPTAPTATTSPATTTEIIGPLEQGTEPEPVLNPEQTIGLGQDQGMFTALISGISKRATGISIASAVVLVLILLFTFAFFFIFFRLRRKSNVLQ
ncbi:MAG: hypothetical protein COT34_00345 [Candidatus Nealsonbacteria bacterium CG08_land_8_20_14_0_20_43_11]|uniref:VWFA domain-containing protein n=1 Tax=Candidatus Nealsonbacteria bacterium CG08_land_8_20_14_0_20_43_11 TaxID=1974706 RepID=A0A2M6T1N1_9BACT|nr:MAG: hypothetical protein COT34_00345 [Candidatus Nealsonbacteria bacterium CG08_land_8_20_14_0_20_43_11]